MISWPVGSHRVGLQPASRDFKLIGAKVVTEMEHDILGQIDRVYLEVIGHVCLCLRIVWS